MSNEVIIEELEFPENIIQNIGMYLGSTKEFTTPLREIINNSTDEVLNNYGNFVGIYSKEKIKVVIDDGRGLPYYIDPKNPTKVITETILTKTHSGSKFSNKSEKTGGLHGVGSTAVNAISKFYQVYVNTKKKDNSTTLPELSSKIEEMNINDIHPIFTLRYENGRVTLVDVVSFDDMKSALQSYYPAIEINDNFSTAVAFTPNLSIYESDKSKVAKLPLKLVKLENTNCNITVDNDQLTPFSFDHDVYGKESQLMGKSFSLDVNIPEVESSFKIFFTFDKDAKFDYQHTSLINLIETPQGGYIEDVVWRSIGNALKEVNPLHKQADGKLGLRMFVSSFSGLKMFFNSQTKEKLNKLAMKGDHKQKAIDKNIFINKISKKIISDVITQDPEFFRVVSERLLEYKRSLDRLSKKDFVLSHIEYSNGDLSKGLGMGARVFDCTNKNPDNRILYITEGKSAGGSLIKARKERLKDIAILPLRGVPLNAATSNINAIVQNNEFKSIINTLGTGLDPFIRMEKRRYAQIILSPDADPAGQFIGALLLGFFGMYLRPWIEEGRVFLALSPLYRQNGKFIFDEKDLNKKKEFTRFKGLGEMNPSDIRETHIDNPRFVKITIEDVDKALKLIINASNERKALSKELGILTDKETFLEAVGDSEIEIMGNFEDALASDDEDDKESSEYDEQLESEVEVA